MDKWAFFPRGHLKVICCVLRQRPLPVRPGLDGGGLQPGCHQARHNPPWWGLGSEGPPPRERAGCPRSGACDATTLQGNPRRFLSNRTGDLGRTASRTGRWNGRESGFKQFSVLIKPPLRFSPRPHIPSPAWGEEGRGRRQGGSNHLSAGEHSRRWGQVCMWRRHHGPLPVALWLCCRPLRPATCFDQSVRMELCSSLLIVPVKVLRKILAVTPPELIPLGDETS